MTAEVDTLVGRLDALGPQAPQLALACGRSARKGNAPAGGHDAVPWHVAARRQSRQHLADQARLPRQSRARRDRAIGRDPATRDGAYDSKDRGCTPLALRSDVEQRTRQKR
jgi:hypothetical protein